MENMKRIETLVVATLKSKSEPAKSEMAILEVVLGSNPTLRRVDNHEEVLNHGISSNLVAATITELPDYLLTEDEILTDQIHVSRLMKIQDKLNQELEENLGKKPYTK